MSESDIKAAAKRKADEVLRAMLLWTAALSLVAYAAHHSLVARVKALESRVKALESNTVP